MRVFILGSNGMLGRYMYVYLNSLFPSVVGLTRKEIDASKITDDIPLSLKEGDTVVNCIGLIPQRGVSSPVEYITVNALFPHLIAGMCDAVGAKFVHVSTDCVFAGDKGGYTEDSIHDATDIYGRTKSLGEPESATIIRTSIIGEELQNKKSLLEWVRFSSGGKIKGYTDHIWNGVTCLCLAQIVGDLIEHSSFWKGVKHVFSPEKVNKYELVKLINDVYNLDIVIDPVKTGKLCDKSLISTRDSIKIEAPPLETQIREQKEYSLL